jgi:branched-chain amino acid transport system ATP-binding protein
MPNLLKIEGLSKAFGGLWAVQNYSLELPEGKLFGLIGPNGAGKTTIFNLITGILKSNHGSIKFADLEIVGKRPDQIALLGIARTFQLLHLYGSLTVEMNLKISYHIHLNYNFIEAFFGFPKYSIEEKEMKEMIETMLELFKLEKYRNVKASALPYGLQRKLDIARCLVRRPRLLLLDEPSCGMNTAEVEELRRLIEDIKQKFSLTMIIVEHRVPFIMGLAEYIQVLDHGILISTGNPNKIKNNPKVIEAYLGVENDVT